MDGLGVRNLSSKTASFRWASFSLTFSDFVIFNYKSNISVFSQCNFCRKLTFSVDLFETSSFLPYIYLKKKVFIGKVGKLSIQDRYSPGVLSVLALAAGQSEQWRQRPLEFNIKNLYESLMKET